MLYFLLDALPNGSEAAAEQDMNTIDDEGNNNGTDAGVEGGDGDSDANGAKVAEEILADYSACFNLPPAYVQVVQVTCMLRCAAHHGATV